MNKVPSVPYFFSCCSVRFLFGDRETNKKQFFREKMVLRFDRRMGGFFCEKRWGNVQTRERGKSEFWLKNP